jgi:hypothetical protein
VAGERASPAAARHVRAEIEELDRAGFFFFGFLEMRLFRRK